MSMQASHNISSTGHPRYLHRTALIAALMLGATVSQGFSCRRADVSREGFRPVAGEPIHSNLFAASSSLQLAFMGEETATDELRPRK